MLEAKVVLKCKCQKVIPNDKKLLSNITDNGRLRVLIFKLDKSHILAKNSNSIFKLYFLHRAPNSKSDL